MRSFIAGIRRLVLPWGAITGARLVLDGTTGSINVFNAANELIISLDAAGVKALGTGASGSYVLLFNSGTVAQITLNPPAQGGHVIVPSSIESFAFGAPVHVALEIDSPTIDGGAAAFITLVGEDSASVEGPICDITCDELRKNSVRGRLLVWGETYPLTAAPLVLTGIAQNIPLGASRPSGDVPAAGGLITVTTVSPDARWDATLWTDATIATAADTTVGELKVDGAVQTPQALFSLAGTTGRDTVSQGWQGAFAVAGAHTFQATGRRTGGGAADAFQTLHTQLRINVYE